MLFSTSQNSIKKMLKKYFQPKSYLLTSMGEQLQKIVRWVGNYSNDEKVQVGKVILQIQKMLMKYECEEKNVKNPYWLIVFKSMLLIHELLTSGVVGSTFQTTLQAISQALEHVEQLNLIEIQLVQKQLAKKPTSINLLSKQKQALFDQQILCSKILKPYHNYLRKRCQLLPTTTSPHTKCYYLINMLNLACSCNQVIYLFGRYHQLDEFFIINDFNFTLAKDCSLLYGLMRKCVDFQQQGDKKNPQQHQKQYHYQQLLSSKNNGVNNNRKMKLPISEIDDILLQTHQKLYHIFYNKYNYKRIEHYVPQWINLDKYENKSKLNQMHGKNIRCSNNNKSMLQKNGNFYDQDEHIALDQTACSAADKQLHRNLSKPLNSSQLSNNNNNISNEFRQQSIQVIHDLQQFLQKFDENI